ncbi:MAG TPA: sigma 54-interacting transcriptional regulator [Pseudobdellovibrionaceae bacterium]|jgi:DNA-binding NtrC family response regulator
MKAKILLIEDDESFARSFSLILREQPVEVVWAADAKAGIQAYKAAPYSFATVVIDYVLPDLKGSEVCQHLRRLHPEQEFLFTSGHRDLDILTDILETGTSGFLRKGRSPEETRERVLRSLEQYSKKTRIIGADNYSPSQAELELNMAGMTGCSKGLYQVVKDVQNYKQSPYSTLIVGETGVGKELVAQALVPKGKNLITINCAAFRDKENLLESELFGHVKGAFTGADKNTVGLVAQAHNNVLFLDELHHLSISAQAKLLRFLQEMKYRQVGDGSGKETSVNFKLITAVQPDIKERVADGRFMQDLIRRVNDLVIQVPALNERPEDIEPLVRKFQNEFNTDKPVEKRKQFRISTINEMMRHNWIGNIRTLKGAIRQMLTDCQSDIIEPKDFKNYLLNKDVLSSNTAIMPNVESIEDAKNELESKIMKEALALGRTRSQAALRLGMALSTFTRRLKELGINPELYLKT